MKRNIKKALLTLSTLLLCTVSLLGCSALTSDIGNGTEDTKEEETVKETVSIKNGYQEDIKYYKNPLADSAADPFILKHGDTYYLYSTGNKQLSVRTSKDLVTWKGQTQPIFSLSDTKWAYEKCWAPEVYEYEGKFYLFYSAKTEGADNGRHHIGVAVCDTPNGRFLPLMDEPLINESYSTIDVSLFIDDDGQKYLYYSKDNSTNYVDGKRTSQSFGIKLADDFKSTIGEPVLCATPTYDWELQSGSVRWNEGPVVFKREGRYYILYSANYYVSSAYSVGYAVSDTPLGLYDKPKDSRILYGNGETITGSGHCNILYSGDDIYLVYHSHTVPPNTDKGRSLYIDQLVFKADGTPYVNGPSNTKRPLPDGVGGTDKISPELTAAAVVGGEEKDASVLFDGCISRGFADVVSLSAEDHVTVTLSAPAAVDSIWIYPSCVLSELPKHASVLINGEYLIENIPFSGERGEPAVAILSNLPENTEIHTVTVTLTPSEGYTVSGISELQFVNFN